MGSRIRALHPRRPSARLVPWTPMTMIGAPLPAGPALLGLRSGAPIMVMGVHGTRRADGRRGWRARILEPIDPADYSGPHALTELTQEVATRLEHLIAVHPEEWHVFQPFWSADRPSRPS